MTHRDQIQTGLEIMCEIGENRDRLTGDQDLHFIITPGYSFAFVPGTGTIIPAPSRGFVDETDARPVTKEVVQDLRRKLELLEGLL